MRAGVAALVSTVIIGTSATLVAPPAQADDGTPGCVSQGELNQAKKGFNKKRVVHIFGTSGKRTAVAAGSGPRIEFYSYPTCSTYGTAQVSYRDGRLYARSAQF